MIWDRMDAQDRIDREQALADRSAELENACRRLGVPIPEVPRAEGVALRPHENYLMDQVNALEKALAAFARDRYAARNPHAELAALRAEVAELEAILEAMCITPPDFTVDPRFYANTERMAWKRRRDTLWKLLEQAEG